MRTSFRKKQKRGGGRRNAENFAFNLWSAFSVLFAFLCNVALLPLFPLRLWPLFSCACVRSAIFLLLFPLCVYCDRPRTCLLISEVTVASRLSDRMGPVSDWGGEGEGEGEGGRPPGSVAQLWRSLRRLGSTLAPHSMGLPFLIYLFFPTSFRFALKTPNNSSSGEMLL